MATARSLNRLSARFVATASKQGLYADGGNLYLQVGPTGSKSWIFRYKRAGKPTDMGLGPVHTMTLAQAREEAASARQTLLEGRDPLTSRRADRARIDAIPTFEAELDAHIENNRTGWRNTKHAAQWKSSIVNHAERLLPRKVDAIETEDVLAVLKPIWSVIPETASRIRGRIEAVLDGAIAKGLRQGPNPSRWKGHLELLLPAREKLGRGHMASLPYSDMPVFWEKLKATPGEAARALEWMILNVNRPGETRFARAEEIVDGLWTIPGERMKAGKPHEILLSAHALDRLNRLPRSGLLFPAPRSRTALSDAAMSATLKRMGYGHVTPHGFRSSFKVWATDVHEAPDDLSEAVLAHVDQNKSRVPYKRTTMLARRKELMEAWADYLNGLPAANPGSSGSGNISGQP